MVINEHDNGDSKYGNAENLDIVKGKREKTRDVKKPVKPDQYRHSYFSLPLSLPFNHHHHKTGSNII